MARGLDITARGSATSGGSAIASAFAGGRAAPQSGPMSPRELADAADAPRPAVTWRSLLIGTVAVALICGLTPFNDYVLSDTNLTAGFLPVGAVLVMFLLIVAINAPLHRLAPRHALGAGELAVVCMMALLASSLPSWGLMKFLVPTPVAPFRVGVSDDTYWTAFRALDLPAWLFPVTSVADGRSEGIVSWFYTSTPTGERVDFSRWVVPLLAWGVFAAAMVATLVSLARIVVYQWAVNERLPFPLVEVQESLIRAPDRGRAFNEIFRSPLLWVGLGSVFFIHSLTAVNTYFPNATPRIPLEYNLSGLFANPPLDQLPTKVKAAKLSFMVIGATYFIRSRTAFSLFGIYLLVSMVNVTRSAAGMEPLSSAASADQHLGASLAFIGGILWIGREHWKRVVANAFGRGPGSEYRVAFWVMVAGIATMVGWLLVVGVQWWMALLIVVVILAAHLVVSRVIAETGLPWYRSGISASQVYSNLPIGSLTGRSVYMAQTFTVLGPLTTRDSAMGFATTGFGVTREFDVGERPGQRWKLGAVVVWALLLGAVIAASATLWCHYHYATPGVQGTVPERNYFGADYIPRRDVANPFNEYSSGRFAPKAHDPLTHFGIGFAVTAVLQVGVLRFAGWPLLPVGFVTSHGAFVSNAWFSIFAGWLAKVLLVRFGGSRLYMKMRPLFVGVIFGEALAAGALLAVNAVAVMNGYESQSVKFLL
jgi:hypothetical protein